MIGLLAANTVLIILLAMTNWDRILGLLWWLYSAASGWVTTSTVLGIYGLVLLYLLIVVRLPAATENSSRKRRKKPLVPYYDHDGRSLSLADAAATMLSPLSGQLKGWVKEEQEETVPTEARTNSPRGTTVRPQLFPELLRRRHRTSPPVTATGALPSRSDEPLADFPLSTWNGFPDGGVRCHFTRQQVEDTSRLALYWISDKLPERRGLRLDQMLLGKPRRSALVERSVVFYRDGAVFENSGTHNHSKYTHSLPPSKNKKTLQLQEFISRQPIVLRGSKSNINDTSEPSDMGEDDNAQVKIEPIDSDADDLHSHDDREDENAYDSGHEMNSEEEKALDPSAERDEEEP
ncbi:hypothetical protein B0H14DRAFT_2563386 [Mycena olivaceomarginata]|nr:hypothetical protein B0H14DRAFT_2563386 [Mycena olivaceomarginata]